MNGEQEETLAGEGGSPLVGANASEGVEAPPASDAAPPVEQVVVRGKRRTSTAKLSTADGTIEAAPSAAEPTITLTVLDVQPATGETPVPPTAHVERTLHSGSEDASETATIQPPAPSPEPPDRTAAAAHVERFLGQQGSLRDATVAELNDDEVREVLVAGGDRHTARSVIKSILSRAYDRRRDAAAFEARDRESALRRSSSALVVLQGPLGMSADDSAKVLAKLTNEEQKQLADVVMDDPEAKATAQAVLQTAEKARQPKPE